MSILERLLSQNGRAAKMGDRSGGAGESGAQTPDILPLGGVNDEVCEKYNVLVSVTGNDLDAQLMAIACSIAKTKRNVVVHAIYGLEVPRAYPVNADVTTEMPERAAQANAALDQAAASAAKVGVRVIKEQLQTRNLGQSLVDASGEHGCALLIVGAPYRLGMDGQFDLGETVDYVLKNATSRVWVVRGQPPVAPSRTERAPEHVTAS